MNTLDDFDPDAFWDEEDTRLDTEWDIRREGRRWGQEEARPRYQLSPGKVEMIGGKLFCTQQDRLVTLALLLENLGIDRVVQFGDPKLWREALARLEQEMPTED